MKKCYVYIIRSGDGVRQPVKIGMADDPKKRIKTLQTGNPNQLHLVMIIECNSRRHARLLESTLHNHLCGVNVLGEWYKIKEHQLYKVLRQLGSSDECRIVEEHQTESVVSKERSLLRSERKRSEGAKKANAELEKILRRRSIEVKVLRNMLYTSGLDSKQLKKDVKEEVEKRAKEKGLDIYIEQE